MLSPGDDALDFPLGSEPEGDWLHIDIVRDHHPDRPREPDWAGKKTLLAELRADLVKHGVPTEMAGWQQWSTAGDSFSWLVAAVSGGGAGTTLALALHKFVDRHKGKQVVLRQDGSVAEVTGYSAEDVERILKVAMREERGPGPDQGHALPQPSDQND